VRALRGSTWRISCVDGRRGLVGLSKCCVESRVLVVCVVEWSKVQGNESLVSHLLAGQ